MSQQEKLFFMQTGKWKIDHHSRQNGHESLSGDRILTQVRREMTNFQTQKIQLYIYRGWIHAAKMTSCWASGCKKKKCPHWIFCWLSLFLRRGAFGMEYEMSTFTSLDAHKAERDINHWIIAMNKPGSDFVSANWTQNHQIAKGRKKKNKKKQKLAQFLWRRWHKQDKSLTTKTHKGILSLLLFLPVPKNDAGRISAGLAHVLGALESSLMMGLLYY